MYMRTVHDTFAAFLPPLLPVSSLVLGRPGAYPSGLLASEGGDFWRRVIFGGGGRDEARHGIL